MAIHHNLDIARYDVDPSWIYSTKYIGDMAVTGPRIYYHEPHTGEDAGPEIFHDKGSLTQISRSNKDPAKPDL